MTTRLLSNIAVSCVFVLALLVKPVTCSAQVPVITSFSPVSGPIGTVILVSGNNFSKSKDSNIVYIGAVKATVLKASTTQLTVKVPVGATYEPLTVTAHEATAYSKLAFDVTFAGGYAFDHSSFISREKFTFGGFEQPENMDVSDLDGDGKPDLTSTNGCACDDHVSVTKNLSTPGVLAIAGVKTFLADSYTQYVVYADFDGDGVRDMAVINQMAASITIFKNISTNGNIIFSRIADYPTYSYRPVGIAAADFDLDGKPDIVIANDYDNILAVFRNTSTSQSISFERKLDIATGKKPMFIATGDWDSDGRPDIVTVNNLDSSISILQNITDGQSLLFAAKQDIKVGASPRYCAVGDLNNDGKPDIGVTNYFSNTISIFKNISNETGILFDNKVDIDLGNRPLGIAFGDLNGDGKPDIAATNWLSGKVTVFQNLSSVDSVSFAKRVDFLTGVSPTGVTIADFDGDSRPELFVANHDDNTISIYRNVVNQPTIASFSPLSATIGDTVTIKGTRLTQTTSVAFGTKVAASFSVVSDSILKAVVAKGSTGSVRVTTSLGVDSLAGFRYLPTPPVITKVVPAFGDTGTVIRIVGKGFSGQRQSLYFGSVKAPIITSSDTVLTAKVPAGASYQPLLITVDSLSGYSPMPFDITFPTFADGVKSTFLVEINKFTAETYPNGVFASDFDGDGLPDLVIVNQVSDNIEVFRSRASAGKITFGNPIYYETGMQPKTVYVSDFNGDGKPDIVVANSYYISTVSVFINTSTKGNVSFENKKDFNAGSGAGYVTAYDVDKDGKIDIITSNELSNSISVLLNTTVNEDVSFAASVDFPVGGLPTGVFVADLDDDGIADIVVSNYLSHNVSIIKNKSVPGRLSLAPKADWPTGNGPQSISVVDLDADHKADLVITNQDDNNITILKNTSTSTAISFTDKVTFATGLGPVSAALTDIDGDGKPDIITANHSDKSISVFKNISSTGNIVLADKRNFNGGTNAVRIFSADFDKDGKPDLALANSVNNSISILRNSICEPDIYAFSPDTAGYNDKVTILGYNLKDVDQVFFGGTPAKKNSVVSDSKIVATVGVGSTGIVQVKTRYGITQLNGFVFKSGGAMPLTLIKFDGLLIKQQVRLNWQTTNEQNTALFYIERSKNGEAFEDLGLFAAAGTSTTLKDYAFNDVHPFKGINYYRLKMADADGKFTYSKIIGINNNLASTFTVYPNPAKNYILVKHPSLASATIKIIDIQGKALKTIPVHNTLQTNISLKGLAPGTYIINLSSGQLEFNETVLLQ